MRREKEAVIFTKLGVVFLLFFCLIPFLWMLIISFNERSDFLLNRKIVLTLKNYLDIISVHNLHFLSFLKNSMIVAGLSAVLSTMVASLAAYAVSRIKFSGRFIFIIGVLGLSMFPQICIVGYLYKFMSRLGWINTYPGLLLPYIAWSLPLGLWIMLSYFSQIPKELDEAAMVDGASRFQILTRVILPVALPGFFSTMLLLFIFSFNEFLFALMLTTDYHARTVPVGIALFQGLHGEIPWGYIMSASTVSCLPVILIALIFQKQIIQGLTRGAVKQ